MARLLLSLLLLLPTTAVGQPLRIPRGWRLPRKAETLQSWRQSDPDRYLQVRARVMPQREGIVHMLVNKQNQRVGVFLFVQSSRTRLLDTLPAGSLRGFGIKLLPAGRYETACGKGYYECGKGAPAFVESSDPLVCIFKTESTEAVYMWNPKRAVVVKVQLSD